MSVAFFFCVSGYLMTRSVYRAQPYSGDGLGRDTVLFMVKRIKSIFPWYFVAWIMSFFLLCIYYGLDYMVQGKTLIESIFPTFLIYMAGFDGFEVVGAIWYLSAMYLCMPLIYMFLRAKRDAFIWVIAPLLSLFLYGYMQKVYGGFGIGTTWIGFCYGGIIFAVAGLSSGCFCYGVSEWIRRQALTILSRAIVTVLDIGIFFGCLILMQICPEGAMNATVAFLLVIVVTISFSEKSYSTTFFNKYCSSPLVRELSIAIYLCNGRTFFILMRYFPDLQSYEQRLFLYVLFTLAISIVCVISVRMMRKWYQKYGNALIHRLFLQTERS